jgi:hypothetical protein
MNDSQQGVRIVPMGCRVAVFKSPDNEQPEPPKPAMSEVADLGFARLFEIGGRHDDDNPTVENGKIVKGVVAANGDCEHHHFEEGQVVWYLEPAAIVIQGVHVLPALYVLAKQEETSTG